MNLFDVLLTKNLAGQDSYTKSETNALLEGKLSLTGGAMVGDITTSVTEFTSASLITKGYVDTIVGDINAVLEEVL